MCLAPTHRAGHPSILSFILYLLGLAGGTMGDIPLGGDTTLGEAHNESCMDLRDSQDFYKTWMRKELYGEVRLLDIPCSFRTMIFPVSEVSFLISFLFFIYKINLNISLVVKISLYLQSWLLCLLSTLFFSYLIMAHNTQHI